MLKDILKILKKMYIKLIDFFIYSYLRIKYLTKEVYINRAVKFKGTDFEGQNKINCGVKISDSKIGFGTYIASNTELENSNIGRYCSIGPNIKIIIGKHPLSPFVSTHPIFYSTMKQNGITYVKENKFLEFKLTQNGFNVEIGNDVWIGSDVRFFQGLVIGNGAIVAAGSIVTKNIPPYEIWGGIPAKKIKDRFLEDEKKELLKIKWWDFSEKKIKDNIELFYNIREFLKKFKK